MCECRLRVNVCARSRTCAYRGGGGSGPGGAGGGEEAQAHGGSSQRRVDFQGREGLQVWGVQVHGGAGGGG